MAPRRTFGATWWGKAWIDALEQRARLDPNRLPRGRTYARQDRAGRLTVSPGTIEAGVQGSRPSPYRVTIRVRTFTATEWDKVFDAIAGRVAHAAALLDGELLPEVLDEVRATGVDLLPESQGPCPLVVAGWSRGDRYCARGGPEGFGERARADVDRRWGERADVLGAVQPEQGVEVDDAAQLVLTARLGELDAQDLIQSGRGDTEAPSEVASQRGPEPVP